MDLEGHSIDVVVDAANRSRHVVEGTILVMPVRIEQGRALYRPRDLVLPKEIESLGLSADFVHEQGERSSISEYSTSELVAFGLGLAGNISWDAAKTLAQYLIGRVQHLTGSSSGIIELRIARFSRPDGAVTEDLCIKGPANAETVEAIIRGLTGAEEDS